MADQKVSYTLDGKVAVLRIDDGKANAVSAELMDELLAALEQAEKEARAVLMTGRPGRFPAGFDLTVMIASPDSARDLVKTGAQFLMSLYLHPLPVVVACTGHALAAGALMLLSADVRIAAEGAFKIGLNEVAIGMLMPGDNVNLEVELIVPVALGQGSKFAIREGGLTVGAGVITKIIA